ncbi:MAG: hypothetical protein D6808_04655 [Candidatus Dadabacteria bacterium]|nr:MAG: hypothetical protein D6808_04655 [Candidatus Dadabacteria bacterium]
MASEKAESSLDFTVERYIEAIIPKKAHGLILSLAGVCALFSVILIHQRNRLGFIGLPLDDSWIHLSIARNFISGDGFGINPGRNLAASTAPLWTLFEAIVMLIVRDPVWCGVVSGFLASLAGCLVLWRFFSPLNYPLLFGFVSICYLLSDALTVWGFPSGMEIPLLYAFMFSLFWTYCFYPPLSMARLFLAPLLHGAVFMTRPETGFLFGLTLISTAFAAVKAKKSPLKVASIQLCVFALSLLPYFWFNFETVGKPFPTTFYAKVSLRHIGLSGLFLKLSWDSFVKVFALHPLQEYFRVIRYITLYHLPMVFFSPLGALFLSKRRDIYAGGGLMPSLGFLLFPLVVGVVSPTSAFSNAVHRYYAVYIPFIVILGSLGIYAAVELFGRKAFVFVLAVLLVFYSAPRRFNAGLHELTRNVLTAKELYVDMAKWLSKNLPQESLLAVNDIGAVSYYLRRPVIDIMGLASPEVWDYKKRALRHRMESKLKGFLKKMRVDYLLVNPNYYPYMLKLLKNCTEIKRWHTSVPIKRLISPQVLYKCVWR